MVFSAINCRRIVNCLAIIASLSGSLQQCHAFCLLTSCAASEDNSSCQECCKCSCSHHACQQQSLNTVDSRDSHLFSHRHHTPGHSECWCCRSSEPLRISSDATEAAKELVASGSLVFQTVSGHLPDHLRAAPTGSNSQGFDSLSSPEFCVSHCRFRI